LKELYIIRHAKSSWSNPSLNDFDRGLKKRGKDDIAFMAKWLKTRVETPDLILSSPAKRAKKTLKAIKKEFEVNEKDILFDERIYEASLDDLLEILTSLKSDKKIVFLIGHNPSLNELAEFLSGVYLTNIPTSGIVGLRFDIDKWSDLSSQKGKIIFFEYPKKLRGEISCE